MATVTASDQVTSSAVARMEAGPDPLLQVAAIVSLVQAGLWGLLLLRWVTFSRIAWRPFGAELALSQWPPLLPYLLYGGFLLLDLAVGIALWRGWARARQSGVGRASLGIVFSLAYYALTRDFTGTAVLLALSGFLLMVTLRQTPWVLAYPSAFWLGLFFIIPMAIVLVVSMGDRARLGTVVYPAFDWGNLSTYFDDYLRFFSKVGNDYIYLRIFWRSVGIAVANTLICLLVGFPFAYWIARQPARYRNVLIFLVMIPFWTNFLVRTYAWMLILRDSGLINNFWTITLHQQALVLADRSELFALLAQATERKLPLLFNQWAVMIGLFYGYLPFMILPLYSNLEQIDWSLLEAAADLGANTLQSTVRILLPLAMPGIVAGSVIVFIPSLGAYVTPDLMGGARVALLGNLLQQQFMTVRDWPFGSAIGFIMMSIMLLATLLYFRTLAKNKALAE